MDCTQVRIWIFQFLDGELGSQEADLLHQHLDSCPSCARDMKLLSLPRRLGRAIPAFEPSPFFYSRLRARLESESQNVTIWPILVSLSRQVVPALATITLALVSILFYMQISQTGDGVYQAYDMLFMSGDRPHRMVIADQVEITDESVLEAIAEEEPVKTPATEPPDASRK